MCLRVLFFLSLSPSSLGFELGLMGLDLERIEAVRRLTAVRGMVPGSCWWSLWHQLGACGEAADRLGRSVGGFHPSLSHPCSVIISH